MHPPWKKWLLSQQLRLKVEVLSSPPFFKFGWKLNLVGGGGCTLCNFDGDWQTDTWIINRVITYSTPGTLEFKSCPVFSLWPESSIEAWLTGRQAGKTGRPKDMHVGWLLPCVTSPFAAKLSAILRPGICVWNKYLMGDDNFVVKEHQQSSPFDACMGQHTCYWFDLFKQ